MADFPDILPYQFKPCPATYILFLIAPIFMCWIVIADSSPGRNTLAMIVLGAIVLEVLLFALLSRYSISLQETTVTISKFFTSNSISLSTIYKVTIELDLGTTTPYNMKIFHRDPSSKNPISINIKFFGKNDLIGFSKYLQKKSPMAEFDSNVVRMGEGKMPSLFFSSK